MKNILFKVRYNGKNYYGWNLQPNKKTIVSEITKAFKSFYKGKVNIHGSGRTDKQVHAIEQTFNIEINTQLTTRQLVIVLNNNLPDDIEIISAKVMDSKFHARYSVANKTYLYKINTKNDNYIWTKDQYWLVEDKLNLTAMKKAAKLFIKTTDFTSFAKITKKDNIDTIKTINKITITKKDNVIFIKVNGNGFLRHMVRKIVATLVEVGKESIKPEFITKALGAKDSSAVPFKAPGIALYLSKVYYK